MKEVKVGSRITLASGGLGGLSAIFLSEEGYKGEALRVESLNGSVLEVTLPSGRRLYISRHDVKEIVA